MSSLDLPKLYKDLRKDCKIPKSIFSNKNPSDLSEFFSLNNVGLGDQLLIMKCFEIFDFETQNFEIFDKVVHNFGM